MFENMELKDQAHNILDKNPAMKKSIEAALSKQAESPLGKPSTPATIASKIKSLKPKNPLTQMPKYTKSHTVAVPASDPGSAIKSVTAPPVRT